MFSILSRVIAMNGSNNNYVLKLVIQCVSILHPIWIQNKYIVRATDLWVEGFQGVLGTSCIILSVRSNIFHNNNNALTF